MYDIFSMTFFDSWFQCMEILWMYQCKFTLFLHFYIENILFFLKFKFLKNAICKLSTLYLYGEWLSNDITLISKYQVGIYYNFVRTQYFGEQVTKIWFHMFNFGQIMIQKILRIETYLSGAKNIFADRKNRMNEEIAISSFSNKSIYFFVLIKWMWQIFWM